MTEKSENIVVVTPELLAETQKRVTPEFLAWFDALTDEDIAAQIAADPDMAPELDDKWFARARPGKVRGVLIAPLDPRDDPATFKDAAE